MRNLVCSVIIPARNCIEDLPVALASVEMQRARDIEAIVIDDGSSGGTSARLAKRSSDWPALRVTGTERSGGAAARNAGIEAARAPLIAFLDAGNWWWPEKLLEQTDYHAAHPDIAFSFTDYLSVSADGESLGTCFEHWQPPLRRRPKTGYFRLPDALQFLLAMNLAGTSTVVASKAALEKAGGFRDFASAEDWDLWLRLAAEAHAACSTSVTATSVMRPSAPSSQELRLAAMGEIISPYENSRASSTRHAAAKARARLDTVRAELRRQAGRQALTMRGGTRAPMAPPTARLGRESAVSQLNEALYFVSNQGAGQ